MSLENRDMPVQSVKEDEGLSLKDLFLIVKKHIIAILAFVVVATAGGMGYAIVKDKTSPTYKASSTMLVQLETSDSSVSITNQYSFSNYIAQTFVSFIKDDVVLDPVAAEYNYTVKHIKSNLSISQTSGTLVLGLSYVDKDPEIAAKVLNSVMASTETVSKTEDSSGQPKYKLLNNNIKTLSEATKEKAVKTSSKTKTTLIFAAVGVVLAFVYVLLREIFDTSFRSTEDVEKELGAPVIAAIPDYEFDDEKKGGKK